MGLLDLISARNPGEARQTLADLVRGPQNRLRGLLDSPVSFLTDALNDVVPTGQQAAEQLQRYQLPMSQDYAMGPSGYDNKLKDMALAGLTVYHGSPHKFDKFDINKIGTGEGAQAYGHGLYFAESPAVANDYAGALSAARASKPVGNVDLTQAYQNLPNDVPETLLAARRDFRALNDYGDLSSADRRDFLEAVKNNITAAKNGNLYKVDIPDEAIPRMLDWDKPLSQQAPEVRQALESHEAYPAIKSWLDRALSNAPPNTEATGQTINEVLAEKLGGQAAVSSLLHKQGIPGIRYLDGGSRGTGSGTSNYVVFDDSLLKILERNGMPVP